MAFHMEITRFGFILYSEGSAERAEPTTTKGVENDFN